LAEVSFNIGINSIPVDYNPMIQINRAFSAKAVAGTEASEPRFLEQVKLFFDRAASKTDIP